MLTRIGDALSGWTPRAAGGDPLSVIRAAWTGLVGNDVARAAQPVAIAGDALVVMTTSSAWSHQLAFLEPRILREIRARARFSGDLAATLSGRHDSHERAWYPARAGHAATCASCGRCAAGGADGP